MQGITGTVQFAQFPGMTGRIYLDTQDLQRLMDVSCSTGRTGATGARECWGSTGGTGATGARECWGSTGGTGPTVVTREYWGTTGGTGATGRYVNVNYTVNANTSGKVVTEITF